MFQVKDIHIPEAKLTSFREVVMREVQLVNYSGKVYVGQLFQVSM